MTNQEIEKLNKLIKQTILIRQYYVKAYEDGFFINTAAGNVGAKRLLKNLDNSLQDIKNIMAQSAREIRSNDTIKI